METKELIFNLPPIVGLLPLLVYIIFSFKDDMNPVVNVFMSALLGAILIKQPLMEFGQVIADAMGSFLVLVGLIIMLGSGLGVILKETGVAENLVNILMNKIGVNTEKKAILATMTTSVILVTLLGTLAGANAVIAPIVIPLVGAMGITPSTLAVIFQGAGQTGLFLGPFSPPIVTLREITGLTYGEVLKYAGLPVAIIMWVVTYFTAMKTQKKTVGKESYDLEDLSEKKDYVADAKTKRATGVCLVTLLSLLVYGVISKSGASYAILVMLVVSIFTGLAAGMKPGEIADKLFEGMSKLVWMFAMFIIFEPFLNFVQQSGAFDALFKLMEPLIANSGQVVFAILATLIGIFGINGAAVAQALLMDSLFSPMVAEMGISIGLWVIVLLVGHQITSFAYPGVDMLGAMGLARSDDIKPMLRLGYSIIGATLLFVVVAAIIL